MANRESWIDNLKFFAICVVMMGHCSVEFFGNYPYKIWFHHITVAFAMPIFFFLSGVTSFKRISRLCTIGHLDDYIQKLCYRLMLPGIFYYSIIRVFDDGIFPKVQCLIIWTILFSILYCLNKRCISTKSPMFLTILYTIIIAHLCFNKFAGLWFFPCLMKIEIAAATSFLLYNRCRKTLLYGSVTFPFFLTIILCLCLKHLFDATAEFVIYFLLGALTAKYYRSVEPKNKGVIIAYSTYCVICFIIASYFTYEFRFYSLYKFQFYDLILSNNVEILFYRQMAGLCWCLFFFYSSKIVSSHYSFISKLGTYTLSIYGVHVVLLSYFKGLVHVDATGWIVWILLLCQSSLLFMVVLLFIKLGEKNWVSNWLINGVIEYKK